MDWTAKSDTAILVEIGRRIKDIRLHKNYTQADIAKMAGVTAVTVGKAERGEAVSMMNFIAILRALKLLDNFEMLIPEQTISPMELLKAQGKKRVRASKPKKNE